MKKLQCQLCGGALVMDVSWNVAECEQCGVKYSKESIQKMLDLKITENTISSCDTWLLKAERQMNIGDYSGAKNVYQKILDSIDPLSTDAWWGLLQCRFHFTDMLLSGQLGKSETIFLFAGKPEWNMSAFEDNLKNAKIHASPEQEKEYEQEYSTFMEALPEKRRESEANKGKEQLERDKENVQSELGNLQTLLADRKSSLDKIKRKKKIRLLLLILSIFATLSTLYIAYHLLIDVRSFKAYLFKFIVSLFIMVVFWMIFSFNKSDNLKKSRINYLTNNSYEIIKQISDAEYKLNELKVRLDNLHS